MRAVAGTAGLGLLAIFLLAAASTAVVALNNAYIAKGFYRTEVHLLSQGLGHFTLPVLLVTAVVVSFAALSYRFSAYGNRILAISLGLVPALAFFLKLGYSENRMRFSQPWHARHEVLGIGLPEALFRTDVWVTNGLIFLGAVAIGIAVWAICRRGLRPPGGFLHRFWRLAGRPAFLAVVLVLFAAPLVSSSALKHAARGRPSFILISLDALRFDHLGCYGYFRDTSPQMDRLADEGYKFEWAFSQAPTTLPSHMSMLTSLYPTVHGCRMGHRLPGERLTLAEYLREQGYGTAGCVGGGYMRKCYGFDQGFERYDDRYKGFADAVRTVLGWLDGGLSKGPFFVFMHTYDIHSPYNPPEPYKSMYTDPNYAGGFNPSSKELARIRRRFDRHPELGHGLSDEDVDFIVGRYDGGIRYVDGLIGKLMRGLREQGLLDTTWVVITADHGEEFAEHGTFLHGMLYITVARVPLIIRPPGPPRKGVEVDEIVELLDLMPTFLDLAHVAPVDTLEGESMTGIMKGDASGWRDLAFTEHQSTGQRSVVSPTLHVIASLEGEERLAYDYHADPLEQSPLDDPSRAEEIDELYSILKDWSLAQLQLASGDEEIAPARIDQKTIDELRALGYIE